MRDIDEIIEVELLSDPTPERETLWLERVWVKPSAIIKNVLTLGLRETQPNDYVIDSRTEIPGKISYPITKFKCDKKTFDKLYGDDRIPNFFTAHASFGDKNYIIEGFFIDGFMEYSPDKEYECRFDYYREV